MPTFHRRSGGVKYVAPRKFFDGFNPRVAIPALVFAVVLIGVIVFALNNAPVEQQWVILRDYPAWRPFLTAAGDPVPGDLRFAFSRPVDTAKTPRASRYDAPMGSEHGALTYNAQPFMEYNKSFLSNHLADDVNGVGGMDTDLGDPVYAACAGRVVFAGKASEGWGNMVIVEHAVGEGRSRRTEQLVYAHLRSMAVGVGMVVQRGDAIGEVGGAEGRYPAHLHLEMRVTDVADPGRGYFREPLNRLDPEKTIAARRGAAEDLLNTAPLIRDSAVEGEELPEIEFGLPEVGDP